MRAKKQTVPAAGATERCERWIRGEILSGRIAPGTLLPGERVLAERLDVARSSVREAIRRLETQGFLSVRHGSGAAVEDYRSTASLDVLPHVLADGPEEDRLRLALDLLSVRAQLGTGMVGLACERADERDVAALREKAAAVRDAPDAAAQMDAEYEYWWAVTAVCGEVVRWTFNTLSKPYLQVAGQLPPEWFVSRASAELVAQVTECMAAHDPARGRALYAAHQEATSQAIGAVLAGLASGREAPPEKTAPARRRKAR